MKKFTVLLLRPDYVADGFGTDTYLAQVESDCVDAAVLVAQAEVAKLDDLDLKSTDYHPLITLEGWHDDITPEVYR
ncbi:MAG: hypothetical protein WCI20_02090 [bacterium]